MIAQTPNLPQGGQQSTNMPSGAVEAQRFLQERGIAPFSRAVPSRTFGALANRVQPFGATGGSTAIWEPLGPISVRSINYGLVTGRVSSIAIDPADVTGNRVYIGTTGGGVWVSQNAGTSNTSSVVFSPLTDRPGDLNTAIEGSISIGAISVQPGATGVILAGTGDPNDALDSYYGSGIFRSSDGGNSWNLIQTTSDQLFTFNGEGFAGFAWSTVNPQLVVAAVSHSTEGAIVNAGQPNASCAGLYYSTDSGATWTLALITDGSGQDVQGPWDMFPQPDGNAATAVVWNPVRRIFIAAVRHHGYYQSSDGVTWTRMPVQPGSGLTAQACPTNPGWTGSSNCPMTRGALSVNPTTGDTFAWTVDANNQDQGLWEDQCAINAGTCSNQSIAFSKPWDTTALETDTGLGPATIADGNYNLVLAAVPSGQDTILLAGANDVWRCSLAAGCKWHNTTNANSCMSAQVAGYQHALAWNPSNPLEIFVGNDSGLWRSMDAIGETEQACSADDASHFQNLNGGLGSLAEVVSMSEVTTTPYTMMTGLGINGTAGVKSTTGPTSLWPEILGGIGGPVAIDPINASNWYVNSEPGVSIHLCAQTDGCTPGAFGSTAVVSDTDVGGDGDAMNFPAPFLVDPLDASQLLVGTCRVWRGPATRGWASTDAISPMLDGTSGKICTGSDAQIRTIAAMPLANGNEIIYVGMRGVQDGGANIAGHLLAATVNPSATSMPAWSDVTANPVSNDSQRFNSYGFDISSIVIDPHDKTGNTVYVTVAGMPAFGQNVRVAYTSTDGGAHWAVISSNLPWSPGNSIVVDPQDANTVYIATDEGVYSTRQIASCPKVGSNCWSAYGTGLPAAPVVQISAAPAKASPSVLAAATYGRGVWQIPLMTAGTQLTTATVTPDSLIFPDQPIGSTSGTQTLTLTNTGGIVLAPTLVAVTGDFSETDNCANGSLNTNGTCNVQVTFTPNQIGIRTGQLTISANVDNGQIVVPLSGTGTSAGVVSVAPASLNFAPVEVGSTSPALQVTVENSSGNAIPVTSIDVNAPFVLAGNGCGTSLAANSDCALSVTFAPKQVGPASGRLTLIDGYGTQTVTLTGTGSAPPTDAISPASLSFSATAVGQLSAAQNVTLTNNGDLPLTSISTASTSGFQSSNNCGTSLAARSSCFIGVVFAPVQVGSQKGTLTVSDALQKQTVSLSGTGLQPAAIGVSPAQLNFGAQLLQAASASVVLTVSNTGGAPMANVGFQITGPSARSFATAASTCGATLNKGGSCTVPVIFTPAVPGVNAATLTVSSATLGVSPVQVSLSGVGQSASGIAVSPPQMSFTESVIGSTSAFQTVTVTNTNSVKVTGLSLTVSPQFSLVQDTCSGTLPASASCTAGVVFTPAGNGVVSGALTVGTSGFANAATVVLNAMGGTAGSVRISPGTLNFAVVSVGTESSPQGITVTNSGPIGLADLSLAVSTGFEITNSTCLPTLAAGLSCTVAVKFAPTSAGHQTGTLTIASSMLPQNAQVPLSGMGFDFSAVIGGMPSQTIVSGQTARYTLNLSTLGGSSGTFTFSCGTLPANSVCTFNPASETLGAGVTGSVTIQIVTGWSPAKAQIESPPRGNAANRVFPVVLGLIVLPVAWGRRRRAILLVAFAALIVSTVTSCATSGGGGGGAPQSSNSTSGITPAGTYSVDIISSANGLSRKAVVSLTVD